MDRDLSTASRGTLDFDFGAEQHPHLFLHRFDFRRDLTAFLTSCVDDLFAGFGFGFGIADFIFDSPVTDINTVCGNQTTTHGDPATASLTLQTLLED